MKENKTPEQRARDHIDAMLQQAGWRVQNTKDINLNDGVGQALREYQTDVGPADYVLFVDRKAVGVIEAKRVEAGANITTVEEQSGGYAAAKLQWINNREPLRFIYESTGIITRFTDRADPKPRSREIFSFHRPETLRMWAERGDSLRGRLYHLPLLNPDHLPAQTLGLRDCQEIAITNLEQSFRESRPRALIQMATGAGKTFTAITAIYRLLKLAGAQRILFLVDTKNLGEQAEQEMMTYLPSDDNRKFTELYAVQRLKSGYIAQDSQVCISTIQRMYSLLKGTELDETAEEINPAELFDPAEPMSVAYNERIPPEFFDFIIIDECHRSIYNVWQQVLDYFDAFLIGLTATPDNRTYGFFKKNVVSEYTREQAVADGVNVDKEIYIIETEIGSAGGMIRESQMVEKRERLTRRKRWQLADEEVSYSAGQLDRAVVNPDQIRTVIRTFRDKLPEIFPGRSEVPKTLIFAKTDSHADDIIQIVREEFAEGNDFCKKVTYRSREEPKSVLAQFRNDYNPRIAVTVDMIATGTDVKPLECLLFMRDVKSRNYFEQMDGRGTRTLDYDDLKKVTPSALTAKTHYVVVDAVGVTRSVKSESRGLIRKPSVPIRDLAMSVMMGFSDEETVTSLAGRLARLNRQLREEDRAQIREMTGGIELTAIVRNLLDAVDPDNIEKKGRELGGLSEHETPDEALCVRGREMLVRNAASVFTGELIELIETIRRDREQTIDHDNLDRMLRAEWDNTSRENAADLADKFESWLRERKDEVEALAIFFDQPWRRREITFRMVGELVERLRRERPDLAPLRIWKAYEELDGATGGKRNNPVSDLTALIALLRRVCGIDERISPYDETVRRNFQQWILHYHSGNGRKFNEEQMEWLRMIRDHVASSVHIERDDFETAPFDAHGGLGKLYLLFGESTHLLIDELNEALAA